MDDIEYDEDVCYYDGGEEFEEVFDLEMDYLEMLEFSYWELSVCFGEEIYGVEYWDW